MCRYAVVNGLALNRIPEAEGTIQYLTVDLDSSSGYGGKLGQFDMSDSLQEGAVSDVEEEEEDPGEVNAILTPF